MKGKPTLNGSLVIVFFLMLVFLVSPNLSAQKLPEYMILTENYPPYSYEASDGTIAGFSAEVVTEICRRIGHPAEFSLLPWSRALNMTQKTDGKILFSTSRTAEREDLFRWVGPLDVYEVVFFGMKERDFSFDSLDELRSVSVIGATLNTSVPNELIAQGFENFDLVADSTLNIRKLFGGRIDLWLSGRLPGIHKVQQAGYDPSLMEAVYVYSERPLYIAFSRSTPDWVILRWQSALDEMKADGSYQAILGKYRE